eukprot:6198561-Pleurochrysis_carterae.AAC.2
MQSRLSVPPEAASCMQSQNPTDSTEDSCAARTAKICVAHSPRRVSTSGLHATRCVGRASFGVFNSVPACRAWYTGAASRQVA